MKKYAFITLLIIFARPSFSQYQKETHRLLNEFIVMVKPGSQVEEVIHDFAGLQIKQCLSKRMNIWLLQRNKSTGSEDFLAALKNSPHIKLAQFNHAGIEERSLIPNDPYFSQQWNLLNTGTNGSVAGADIDAPDAWAINHNNTTIYGDSLVVAVIDGQPDLAHQDLTFFTNYNEVPGNGIDDDGNGYIDDVNGWNVSDTSGNIGGSNAHATHLAGIIGAKTNNNMGIAGVCGGVKILPVNYGNTIESNVVAAYNYVREMRILYDNTFGTKGAYVVATNTSFGIDGGQFGVHHNDYPIWCAMYDSMGAVGILSAAATANDGWDIDIEDDMPTGCPSPWLIAVTNTTSADQRNTGAAYGKQSIDLGAPGTGIYSTLPSNNYGTMTGTSMAAPHVAGAIAAMYAAACKGLIDFYYEKPDSVALLIKQYLLDGAEWKPSLNNITVTGGRLNLYRALMNLSRFNCDSCHFDLSLSRVPITCHGANDGALAVNVSGSVNDYSFLWSNGLHSPECISMPPGFYTVQVTDSTGCRRNEMAEIHQPDSIVIQAIHTIPASGSTAGNITVQATAGNDTLQYSLDGVHYQNTATFVIPANGNYTVYVKSEEGCVVQQSVNVTGLADILDNNFSVHLSPNPARDILNITLNVSESLSLDLSITNILGQTLWVNTSTLISGNYTQTLSTSSWASGMYFLHIANEHGSVVRQFLVEKK